jgi:hypothetical protein
MKFLAVVAAGILATSAIVPATANAAPRHGWKKQCHWEGHGKWKHKVCRRVRW